MTIVLFLNLGMKSVQGGRSSRSQTSQRLSRNGHHWPTASAQVWSSQGANTSASGPHRSRNGGDNIKKNARVQRYEINIYKPDWQWFEVEKCLCIFFWVHGRIFQSTWPQKHLSQMAKCWVKNVGFKFWTPLLVILAAVLKNSKECPAGELEMPIPHMLGRGLLEAFRITPKNGQKTRGFDV